MNQENSSRFIDMAQCYHRMAPYTVPHYNWMQDTVIQLLRESDVDPERLLVDIGGGSGRFVKKYLHAFPKANAVIVDSSPAFLKVAENHLQEHNGRFTLIDAKIEDAWESRLPASPSVIFSMSCIHHLLSEEKAEIYRRSADLLLPGGWLINVDEIRGYSDDAYLRHLKNWWQYGRNTESGIAPAFLEDYRQFMDHFQKWKERNIDHADQPKTKGDDLHESVGSQLDMLKATGLIEVDVYFSYRLWHGIAGRKRISQSTR